MIDWLKRKLQKRKVHQQSEMPPSGRNPANPGYCARGEWTFEDGERTWQESMNLTAALQRVLESRGHKVGVEGEELIEPDSGFRLRPLLVELEPVHREGVRMITTIEVSRHPSDEKPVFEYQHTRGANIEDALEKGFNDWYSIDFVTLCDAFRDVAIDSQRLIIESPGRIRRVTLGPVVHFVADEDTNEGFDHTFCPCCMFTACHASFEFAGTTSDLRAIRAFAGRMPDGAEADCRLNGEDYEIGRAALAEYVKTWPGSGLEYRKQYIIIQDQVTS